MYVGLLAVPFRHVIPRGLLQQARPGAKPLPPAGPVQAAARSGEAAGEFEAGGRVEGGAEASEEAARLEAKRVAFMEDRARIQVLIGENNLQFGRGSARSGLFG